MATKDWLEDAEPILLDLTCNICPLAIKRGTGNGRLIDSIPIKTLDFCGISKCHAAMFDYRRAIYSPEAIEIPAIHSGLALDLHSHFGRSLWQEIV